MRAYEKIEYKGKYYPRAVSKSLRNVDWGLSKYLKPSYPKPFDYIGIDTETDINGDIQIIADSKGRYRWLKDEDYSDWVLEFLSYKGYRNKRLVFYSIRFDIDSALKYLPVEVLTALRRHNHVKWRDYKIHRIVGKRFRVQYKKKHSTNCYDMLAFYRGSLFNAIKTYLNPPVEEIKRLKAMKDARDSLFDLYSRPKIREYCIADALYTERLANLLSNKFYESFNFNLPNPYSIAHLAKCVMKNTCNIPKLALIPFNILEQAYRCYYGGWFEIFYRGAFDKLWKYDINSAFPYEMRNLLDVTKGEWRETNQLHEDAEYGFYKTLVNIDRRTHISPLSFRTLNENIYRPVGKWIADYTKDELQLLQSLKNCDYEIINGWEFYPHEEIYPFKDYVDNMCKLKMEALDPVHRYLYKTISVSSYGIFAETTGGKMGLLFNSVYASIITAKCRCKIFKEHKDNIVWYASDCILSKEPLNLPVSNNIGDWKLEANGEKGLVVMNGTYIVGEHEGERGFPELFKALNHNMKRDRIIKHYNVPYTLAEAMLRKDPHKTNIFRQVNKNCDINGDRKRVWTSDFRDVHDMLKRNIDSLPYILETANPYRELPYLNIDSKDLDYLKRRYILNTT
jgi:hypothetical protein